ncbi:MAG: hypothetical protein QM763_03325 [Agriterribacter sp.]
MQGTSLFAPQSQQPLPNASAVLALGIISIVGCCCYGIPGVICAIIALVLYGKDAKLYVGGKFTRHSPTEKNIKLITDII